MPSGAQRRAAREGQGSHPRPETPHDLLRHRCINFRHGSGTHLGREDPPQNQARDRDRGVGEGVAHAPDASITAADGRPECDVGGRSAARWSPTKSHTARNIAESTRLALTLTRPRAWKRTGRQGGGTLLPSLCSPSFRAFIRKLRILDGVEFIEAPTFAAMVADYLEDDEYRALQLFLAGIRRRAMSCLAPAAFASCDGPIAPRQGQA